MIDLTDTLTTYFNGLDSPESRRVYRSDWRHFVAWLGSRDLDVDKARPSDVRDYVTFLRDGEKAKSTRQRILSVIRSVFNYLIVEEIVSTNPASAVKNLKVDVAPRAPWLEEEDVRRLFLAAAPDAKGSWSARRDRLCLLLFFGLGWRRSEIARVRVEDFDHDFASVRFKVKGDKSATAIVPSWLTSEIKAWCSSTSGPLLPRSPSSSASISPSNAYDIVKAAALRAGFAPEEVTPHGLRRTFTSIAGRRGVSLRDRQRALAHSSSQTTERYDHAKGNVAPGDVLKDLVYGREEKKEKDDD